MSLEKKHKETSEEDDATVAVPLDLLIDIYNEIGDCICFPSGPKRQEAILGALDPILDEAIGEDADRP